jgi:hypothetical protein
MCLPSSDYVNAWRVLGIFAPWRLEEAPALFDGVLRKVIQLRKYAVAVAIL